MRNKIIKSRADLPEWFSSNTYWPISDEISWAMEIKRRLQAKLLLDSPLLTEDDNALIVNFFVESVTPSLKYDKRWFDEAGRICDFPEYLEPMYLQNHVDDMLGRDIAHIIAATPKIIKTYAKEIEKLMKADKALHADIDLLIGNQDCLLKTFEDHGYCLQRDQLLEDLIEEKIMIEPICNYVDKINNPYRALSKFVSGSFCTVDISQDDETLKDSFIKWVHKERNYKDVEIKTSKSPITKEKMNDWNNYKVLQVFDLDLWATLSNVRITDPVIANTLWPSGKEDSIEINPITRLRQVTRDKKIPSIICHDMLERLKGLIQEQYNLSEI